MGDFLKKEWVKIFVNCILSALIFLLGFWLTSSRANSVELNKKIETLTIIKADIPYVDRQDEILKKDILLIKTDVNVTIARIDDNLKEIRSYILNKK